MSEEPSGPRGRRIGVLGTVVLDTIRPPGGGPAVEALGGITYSLAAFEACRPPGWRCVPLMKVGEDAVDEVAGLLERLEGTGSRQGVVVVPARHNRVELIYEGGGERREVLSGGVPGWEWEELEPLLDGCDALYVNLIAGWEIDLGCARRLRDGFAGPVYCDLHSLFLERDTGGARRPRVPDSWRSWFRCFDYVQTNRRELALLADDAGEDPRSLAERLVADGPRALFVTLGADGAAWVAPDPDGDGTRHGRREPPRRVEGGDPTGCGDVWGMACFTSLLEGDGPPPAVAAANRLACRNAAAVGGLGLLGRRPDRAGGPGRDGRPAAGGRSDSAPPRGAGRGGPVTGGSAAT